jgi:hypothetical protein
MMSNESEQSVVDECVAICSLSLLSLLYYQIKCYCLSDSYS